jgi:hypothetical protein
VESPLFRRVALCAEFPNDNPSLYEAVEAALVAESEAPPEVVVEPPTATATPTPTPIPTPMPTDAVVEAGSGTDPAPPVLEAEDETDDIEIVDELVIEGAVEEAHVVEEAPSAPPPAPDDPFDALVAVLEDVARAAGAADASVQMQTLRVLLGRERIAADAPPEHSSVRAAAAAWQAILRGESEDFSACGASTLDEWSSKLVALALGEPARADSLRRELRGRGVAAFGLVVEAA